MKLENVNVNQWEQKCNSDGSSAVELTIKADIVKDDSPSTFCNSDVRRDFEDYISKYEYGDWLDRERRNTELIKENEELKEKVKDLELVIGGERRISEKLRDDVNSLCDGQVELQNDLRKSEIGRAKLEKDLMVNREERKEWRQRFLNMRNTLGGLIDSEYGGCLPDDMIISHFSNLTKSFKDLTDKKYELSKELESEKKAHVTLEKDLMDVADILQVTGPRTITDIFDKAHYWVHERSIDDEELKDILRMDADASREDILDKTLEVVKEALEGKETHAALKNVYNACLPAKMDLANDCTATDISKEIVRVITNKEKLRNMDAVILGDFLSFRDKVKKMVGCESNECSEILDVLKRHLEDKKELSGKLEMLCRFRDDVMATFGIRDYDGSYILYELSRAALLAEKAEFICGYFDVKQVPLTSLAENLCIEIKEKVISEYKKEVEEKKAGSVGNGVYLDGQTVEQNLRAENVRLKAECDEYKKDIKELKNSLSCIYSESATALGYDW